MRELLTSRSRALVAGSARESRHRFSGNGDVTVTPSKYVLANVDVIGDHEPQPSGPLVQATPPVTKLLVLVERPQRSEDERPGPAASNGENRPSDGARCSRRHWQTSIMLGAVNIHEQVPSKFADIARWRCRVPL